MSAPTAAAEVAVQVKQKQVNGFARGNQLAPKNKSGYYGEKIATSTLRHQASLRLAAATPPSASSGWATGNDAVVRQDAKKWVTARLEVDMLDPAQSLRDRSVCANLLCEIHGLKITQIAKLTADVSDPQQRVDALASRLLDAISKKQAPDVR